MLLPSLDGLPITLTLPPKNIATLLPPTVEGVMEAAERLKSGRLLAFPTETVYGLGANALVESAVLDIFKVKGRPLTDPLIVHVPNVEEALKCLIFPVDPSRAVPMPPDSPMNHSSALSPSSSSSSSSSSAIRSISEGRLVFDRLTDSFWPGALTIVALGSPILPSCVSAGTGYVGVRCPSHPLALRILTACGVPVAAPSANRFGHVSPTLASHVMSDLGNCDIAIMDGEDRREIFAVPACEFGIESTIVKINEPSRELVILRRGAISRKQLESALIKGVASPGAKRNAMHEAGKTEVLIKWRVVCVTTHSASSLQAAKRAPNGDGTSAGHQHHQREAGGNGASKKRKKGDDGEGVEVCDDHDDDDSGEGDGGEGDDDKRTPTSSPDNKKKRLCQSSHSALAVEPLALTPPPRSSSALTPAISGLGHVAPGQELTHYAPDGLQCFLVRAQQAKRGGGGRDDASSSHHEAELDDVDLTFRCAAEDACGAGGAVVVDFNGQLAKRKLGLGGVNVVAYKDLSAKGDVREATKNLFATLRWSENFAKNAERVLIADIAAFAPNDEFTGGIADRMFRSASGKVILLS